MNTQLSEVYEFNTVNPVTITLPNQDALRRLAISDSGFVFDPVNGDSFTINACGLTVLRSLKDGQGLHEVLERITKEYDVDSRKAERDISDFIIQLRKHCK
ncbi:MAG: PqqD family protein [Gammaproteobacteria bacterium]|jgi:hypothetical protein